VRYAWDLQHEYLRESHLQSGLKSWIARICLHYLRLWDVRTAHGVDVFLACSGFIARRIRKVYRRDATVVYPPVDIDRFGLRADKEDFYLAASRLVPYKRMAMIAEAFVGMPDKRLVMIGDGPELDRIRTLTQGAPNIQILGHQPWEVLVDYMGRARAFLFAAEEDFGITPVEAQACGTPVIAYGVGGALETVVASPDAARRTGVFFHRQSATALVEAIGEFEAMGEFKPEVCRRNAERFSHDSFRRQMTRVVADALQQAVTEPDGIAARENRHFYLAKSE
jgi:glycosyltransferase involved in cell wall biosynthesis